ncbi:MAG: hypothetical protein HYY35_11545 [Deltaproteobacteria bacterium]|nr:hypothetical protein [Deltaproteobacteria bacterium]
MTFRDRPLPRSQRAGDRAPVFAVGQRAYVSGAGSADGSVVLTDGASTMAVGRLNDGAEVEITEWVPRGPATRYRVRSKERALVGWLAVSSLRSTPASVPTPSTAAPVYVPVEARRSQAPSSGGGASLARRKR